jgi:hypothetical protein
MKMRAGIVCAGAFALTLLGAQTSANAQELSEKAVRSFMDYAWSLTPQQFSKPDGSTVVIDKKKKDAVMVPIEVARDVIKVGRLSAHAQVCDLRDDQIGNHRAMMRREISKGKWSPQQEVYISQLHLTTVMLLTGKIKLVEKDGDKEVVVDEGKAPQTTCTEEQRKKVKDLITAYVAASPAPPAPKAAAAPAGAPTSTGSTSKPAGQPPTFAIKPAAPAPSSAAQK